MPIQTTVSEIKRGLFTEDIIARNTKIERLNHNTDYVGLKFCNNEETKITTEMDFNNEPI